MRFVFLFCLLIMIGLNFASAQGFILDEDNSELACACNLKRNARLNLAEIADCFLSKTPSERKKITDDLRRKNMLYRDTRGMMILSFLQRKEIEKEKSDNSTNENQPLAKPKIAEENFEADNNSSTGGQTTYFNKLYDNDTLWEWAESAIERNDSGYFVQSSTIDLNAAFPDNGYSIFSFSTGNSGNLIKQKVIGGSGYEHFPGQELIKSSDGGYISAGIYQDLLKGTRDILLTKYDLNGDSAWVKVIGDSVARESANRCRQTKDGGFIVVGWHRTSIGSNSQLYLLKVDSSGNKEWDTTYGGGYSDVGYSVEQTNDGGFIVGGYYESSSSSGSYWVIKTDSFGNKQWDRKINVNDQIGCKVIQCNDHNYIIYGVKSDLSGLGYQAYILKLDENNDSIIWEKEFGGTETDQFWYVTELSNSNLFIVGSTDNAGTYPLGWMMELSPFGDSLWSRIIYTRNDKDNYLSYARQLPDGSIIACGSAFSVTNSQDAWVIKTDSNGNTCSFAGCDSVATGFADMQMSKLADVQIYPNPFSHSAYLRITNLYEFTNGKLQLSIYNLLGEKVKQSTINNQQSTISRDGLPNGIYFYQIKNKEGMLASGKFIVSD